MARLGTRTMVLSIGGTDVSLQINSTTLSPIDADPDFFTFGDIAAGNDTAWLLKFNAQQDMATGTLWDKVWTGVNTSVAYIVKPYGNATASATQPHFTGNVTIKWPTGDFIGGEIDKSTTAAQQFSCEWPCDAKPTRVTA